MSLHLLGDFRELDDSRSSRQGSFLIVSRKFLVLHFLGHRVVGKLGSLVGDDLLVDFIR
jgi:hypothetical protein